MVILEVLVGTEIVISLSSLEKVQVLLKCVKDYVDRPTYRLLKDLLIQG